MRASSAASRIRAQPSHRSPALLAMRAFPVSRARASSFSTLSFSAHSPAPSSTPRSQESTMSQSPAGTATGSVLTPVQLCLFLVLVLSHSRLQSALQDQREADALDQRESGHSRQSDLYAVSQTQRSLTQRPAASHCLTSASAAVAGCFLTGFLWKEHVEEKAVSTVTQHSSRQQAVLEQQRGHPAPGQLTPRSDAHLVPVLQRKVAFFQSLVMREKAKRAEERAVAAGARGQSSPGRPQPAALGPPQQQQAELSWQ